MDIERYRAIVDDWTAFAEAASRPEPTVFRVRGGVEHEGELLRRLTDQGFRLRSLDGLPGFHQVEEGPYPLSRTIEHWLGLLYVQQASTGVAAPALGPRPGERILDMCSAPGGKTTHMADLMGDRGCLVASELSEPRIRGLLGNVYRLGHTGIFVVSADGRRLPGGALFDHVLLDAPCSGEGTLRRSGGQAPNQSGSFLSYVTTAQRALLERAVALTRPGGTILYVTCTFAPEENEAVVSEALERLPVDLEPLVLPVPHARGLTSFEGLTFDPRLEGAARVYPHHLDSGGLFLARLRRLDGDADGHGAKSTTSGSGWQPVPTLFPPDADPVADRERPSGASGGDRGQSGTGASPLADERETEEALERGVAEVVERFEIDRDLSDFDWTLRGGRAWVHSVDAWPLDAWLADSGDDQRWRPISVGIRAIDFDSRGRPRPTNDFLRWLGRDLEGRTLDVDLEAVRTLLARKPVAVEVEDRGPIALRFRGDVLGRGAVTVDGLKSEIPKARAADLRECLRVSDPEA